MIKDELGKYGTITRLILFGTGLAVASFMLMFSFDYNNLRQTFTIIGYDISDIIIVAGIVLLTVLSGWLIKIGITGKTGY